MFFEKLTRYLSFSLICHGIFLILLFSFSNVERKIGYVLRYEIKFLGTLWWCHDNGCNKLVYCFNLVLYLALRFNQFRASVIMDFQLLFWLLRKCLVIRLLHSVVDKNRVFSYFLNIHFVSHCYSIYRIWISSLLKRFSSYLQFDITGSY